MFIARNLLAALIFCSFPVYAAADASTAGTFDKAPAAKVQPEAVPPVAPAAATTQAGQQPTSAVKIDPPQAAQTAIKIGYVDLIRISNDSAAGKSSQAKLVDNKKKFQLQIDAKRKQLDKQRADIEAKLSSLSPQQREAKSKEFGKKVEELQKFGLNAEKQLQDMQQELSSNLLGKIEQAADNYGKKNGFTAIIVKRDLLYAASGVDVRDATDDVVKILDADERKK